MKFVQTDKDIEITLEDTKTLMFSSLAKQPIENWPEEVLYAPLDFWSATFTDAKGKIFTPLFVVAAAGNTEKLPFTTLNNIPADTWIDRTDIDDVSTSPLYQAIKTKDLTFVPVSVMRSVTVPLWTKNSNKIPSLLELAGKTEQLENVFNPPVFYNRVAEMDALWQALAGDKEDHPFTEKYQMLHSDVVGHAVAPKNNGKANTLDSLFAQQVEEPASAEEAPQAAAPATPVTDSAHIAALREVESALRTRTRELGQANTANEELRAQLAAMDNQNAGLIATLRQSHASEKDELEKKNKKLAVENLTLTTRAQEAESERDTLQNKVDTKSNAERWKDFTRIGVTVLFFLSACVNAFTSFRNINATEEAKKKTAAAEARLAAARKFESNAATITYANTPVPAPLKEALNASINHASDTISGVTKPVGQASISTNYIMGYKYFSLQGKNYHGYWMKPKNRTAQPNEPLAVLVHTIPTTYGADKRIITWLCYATTPEAAALGINSRNFSQCLTPSETSGIRSAVSVYPVGNLLDKANVSRAISVGIEANYSLMNNPRQPVKPVNIHVPPAPAPAQAKK